MGSDLARQYLLLLVPNQHETVIMEQIRAAQPRLQRTGLRPGGKRRDFLSLVTSKAVLGLSTPRHWSPRQAALKGLGSLYSNQGIDHLMIGDIVNTSKRFRHCSHFFTSAILFLAMLVGCGPSAAELEGVDYTLLPEGDWEVTSSGWCLLPRW